MARILILDDDDDMLDSLGLVLRANGYDVRTRAQLGDVVATVRAERPDLIVLDVMFPEDAQAGFRAARTLRQDGDTADVPILMLSAINATSAMSFGFSEADISSDFLPVDAFLDKPVPPDRLLATINRLL